LQSKKIEVIGEFNPRGGISSRVEAILENINKEKSE